ncbi:cellobiose phosphorylase [Chloroflexota bacterium]
MTDYFLDRNNRFVIKDFSNKRSFSSFLPGIAGRLGIPLWVFYVNRGQAIASFGVKDKDSPIVEFQPANKAYRRTPYEGFRTFIKLKLNNLLTYYEPFSPWSPDDQSQMIIGMNELEIQVANQETGLKTSVLYFLLPNETHAGLVRQVTLSNISQSTLQLEILDGLPIVIPYGISNLGLKEISRTLEAWMAVFNLESGIPFYRLLASSEDIAEVSDIQSGHFYLSFDARGQLLPVLTDPRIIFGQNSAFHSPENFNRRSLNELQNLPQITCGKTPCGFTGLSTILEPGEHINFNSVIGHASDLRLIMQRQEVIRQPGYISEKRLEANIITEEITSVIGIKSGMPEFDAYCRQTFLDNILRGGVPHVMPDTVQPRFVYHLYSRKHGDLERDYNNFQLAPEPYSQGNGNYRDINQNRRNDVFFEPLVSDFNIRTFMNLIQPDAYNPLVLQGSRFTIPKQKLEDLLARLSLPDQLREFLSRPFSLGQLLTTMNELQSEGIFDQELSLDIILEQANQHIEAEFHEGYWIDHWVYNLDLIEDYLSVYPDKKLELLFGQPSYTYYDSEFFIKPRTEKYIKAGDRIRQYGAISEDEEKAALIASRKESPHFVRGDNGKGDNFLSTLFEKLTLLAVLKFTTMDPEGMGIEMEAGKPGWYDALNGLPGLLGSSLPETFELQRLLRFMQETLPDYQTSITLPEEAAALLRKTMALLKAYNTSDDPERDFCYWDGTVSEREEYRQRVMLGFSGHLETISHSELLECIGQMRQKIGAGIDRALSIDSNPLPTYFYYEVVDYDYVLDEHKHRQLDDQGHPFVRARSFKRHTLPPFLEGPTKLLKIIDDKQEAERLHSQVMESPLYDQPLGMFRVCTSLAGETHEIGRARAFTPGWLENESIWTHMSYKYLLALLEAEIYEEFFTHFQKALPVNMDPQVYGRSILENCSFIVSSAHPDKSLHGAGFVARLSGAAAEFLSIWRIMMAGKNPFYIQEGQLCLSLNPILPGWMFTDSGTITFTFLGHTRVTYYNPGRQDTYKPGIRQYQIILTLEDDNNFTIQNNVIGSPYAKMVRSGQVKFIEVFLGENL